MTPDKIKTAALILLLFVNLPSPAAAGTTGKIAGVVTDLSSGDPLPGARVYIEGSSSGTLTASDGSYTLLNISPGLKTVTASLIGHRSVSQKEVRVLTNLTTTLDFVLPTEVLEMPGMIVVAERPIVQKDITSSMKILSQEDLETLPLMNLEDVLKIQPGFAVDADNEIHVRGGRSNELTYYIDGFLVEDPLFGGFGATMSNDAIEELEILSGTFNAEYGDALSGVVNIVTREGTNDYSGMFEYESVMLDDGPYREKDWAGPGIDSQRDENNVSLYEPMDVFDRDFAPFYPGFISTNLSGPVPILNSSFFVSYRTTNENSWRPFGYNLEDDFHWKMATRPGNSMKLTFTGQHTSEDLLRYSHRWKYRPLNRASSHNTSNRVGIMFTHSISDRLYYNILASQTRIGFDTNVGGKLPEQYEEWGTDPSLSFYVKGDDDVYRKGKTTNWYGKGDLTYQWTRRHNIKTGAEVKIYSIELFEVLEPWKRDGDAFALEDRYNEDPIEFSAFIQDKMEFDYFIFNAGLRFDYMNPRSEMWKDIENPESQLVTVPAKYQLSPRIGLSHPVTDRMMLYFSYGKFLQTPSYDAFFSRSRNLDPENLKELSFGLVGNRDLDPQRTTAYEFGLRQEINPRTGFSITAFNKDITGLLGTERVRITGELYPYDYAVYTIIDYANVKGIELSLERRRGKHFRANVNYTLSVAKGNNSYPLESYFNVLTAQTEEQQEFFLDFDRRHIFSTDLTLALGRDEGPRLLGFFPLENVSLNIIAQFSSGLPYTPTAGIEIQLAEKNSARIPWFGTVDLHIEKNLATEGFTNTLFVEVLNLTNRRNVLRVDPITGDVWQVGILGGASPEHLDVAFNPADVGQPRIVRFGLRSSF